MASKVYQDLNTEFLKVKNERDKFELELKEAFYKSPISDNTTVIEDDSKS